MPNPVDSTMPLQQRSAAGNLPSAKVTASWPTNLLPSSTATDSTNRCATRASNCTKIYSTAIQAVEGNPDEKTVRPAQANVPRIEPGAPGATAQPDPNQTVAPGNRADQV